MLPLSPTGDFIISGHCGWRPERIFLLYHFSTPDWACTDVAVLDGDVPEPAVDFENSTARSPDRENYPQTLQIQRLFSMKAMSGLERYAVHTTTEARRQAKPSLRWQSEEVTSYACSKAIAYVKHRTAEQVPVIVPAAVVESRQDFNGSLHVGELAYQKHTALARLRPEVRLFAYFVLQFRNQRRGVTPNLKELARWFAILNDKRAGDVRRYIPSLGAAGICQEDGVLFPLFQIAGQRASRNSHLHAGLWAAARFQLMLNKRITEKKWAVENDVAFAGTIPIPIRPSPYNGATLTASTGTERERPKLQRRPEVDFLRAKGADCANEEAACAHVLVDSALPASVETRSINPLISHQLAA